MQRCFEPLVLFYPDFQAQELSWYRLPCACKEAFLHASSFAAIHSLMLLQKTEFLKAPDVSQMMAEKCQIGGKKNK